MSDRETEPPKGDSESRISFKQVATGLAFCFALYSIYDEESGDALFGFLIAFCLLLHEILAGSSVRLDPMLGALRCFYRNGATYARALTVLTAFGGATLVIDQFFEINFIKLEMLDPWIKRLAPVVVFGAISLYVTTFLSSFFYKTSVTFHDKSLRYYELTLYASSISFLTFNALFWLGSKFENRIPSRPGKTDNYEFGGWVELGEFLKIGDNLYNFFLSGYLISAIFSICSIACCFSRFGEYNWKERDQELK